HGSVWNLDERFPDRIWKPPRDLLSKEGKMMQKLFHCFTAVAASWLFVLPVCAQRNETVTIPTSDGRSIRADLYLPAGNEPKSGVMVLFTFFGWENGRAEVYDHRFGELLAQEGFVALVPNFVDRSVVKNVYAPAILQDLKAIAGWLAVRPEVADKLV